MTFQTYKPNVPKLRGRDLGLPFTGRTGTYNAITDVAGIGVGYRTMIENEPRPGRARPVRTGVTAILPHMFSESPVPVYAGVHRFNGNGEMTGTHWIEDGGYFLGPVVITNTHGVGMAHHATVRWMIDRYASTYQTDDFLWIMPVIAETYDGALNDINALAITEADVRAALDSVASGPVQEGNCGGGTGMITYGFKGGTGTSSRLVDFGGRTFTVGAMVQANHGLRDWLTVLGVPVGRQMRDGKLLTAEQGSIIVVIATDIPLLPHQLQRVAQRASIGISKTGTPGGNSSGDIFLAFSTANSILRDEAMAGRRTMECIPDEWLDPVYMATVRAVDESIVNAMLAAEDMSCLKPDNGSICKAIDPMALLELVQRHYKSA